MATETRQADNPLIDTLLKNGHRFSFFQVIRLLQMLSPDSPPVGHQGPPQRECIRIVPDLTLGYNASDVSKITVAAPSDETRSRGLKTPREDDGPRWEVHETFLGLYGTTSPLPLYYTEEMIELKRQATAGESEGLGRKFLDLFHHRLLSLFYRCWEKYRIVAQFREDGTDWFSSRLLQMLHLAPEIFPEAHAVRPMDVMATAGHAVQQPRSATTLLGILREYFGPGIPIDIEQCVESRVDIPQEQRNSLGVENTTLGDDLSLGSRVPDRACTFRVIVGPLDADTFLDFLPPGKMTGRMRELIDLFNPDCLQTEVELRLDKASIPECRLSSSESLLGWSTWIGNPPDGTSNVRFLFKDWLHGRGLSN